MHKLHVCLSSLCLAGFAGAQEHHLTWVTDFEAAKQQAKKEGKSLVVDFTGSDWCGWCIRLHKEVFDLEAFVAEAPKKYVFVELDFPQRKQLSDALKRQNEELKTRYAVKSFPTIFLCDADGLPYAQTGYQAGGPQEYLAHLTELEGKRTERDAAFAKATQAKGIDAAKALDAALATVPAQTIGCYADTMAQIIALDGKNEAGLKAKYEAKQTEMALAGEVDGLMGKVGPLAQAKDWAAAEKLIGAFIQEKKPTGEAGFVVYSNHAGVLQQMGKTDAAIAVLEGAKTMFTDARSQQMIERMLKAFQAPQAKDKVQGDVRIKKLDGGK